VTLQIDIKGLRATTLYTPPPIVMYQAPATKQAVITSPVNTLVRTADNRVVSLVEGGLPVLGQDQLEAIWTGPCDDEDTYGKKLYCMINEVMEIYPTLERTQAADVLDRAIDIRLASEAADRAAAEEETARAADERAALVVPNATSPEAEGDELTEKLYPYEGPKDELPAAGTPSGGVHPAIYVAGGVLAIGVIYLLVK